MTDADGEFDPEIDLLRRYEKMIQTQIDTLAEIDRKAVRVSRLIAIVIGVSVSAGSFVAASGVSVRSNWVLFGVHAVVTAVALGASLAQAVITYLSSTFEYGPSSELGRFMSEYGVTDQDYKNQLLVGYSDAISRNRQVVVQNARRFQRSLASLLVAIVSAGATVTVLLGTPNPAVGGLVTVSGVTASVGLWRYVTREDYLTLERRL